MNKSRILLTGIIGLLLITGSLLAGCDLFKAVCPGTGECTVTVKQGVDGLLVDTASPRSSCGKAGEVNEVFGYYTGGCKVKNIMDGRDLRYGTHSCDC